MTIAEIKQIPLVEFLSRLGHQPTRRDNKGLWYYAPYRKERNPSLHVNPQRQVWFDFATGVGGDIFSLAAEMSGETDFLRQADFIAEKMRLPAAPSYKPTQFIEEPTFENVRVSRLTSPALLKYLHDRGIPRDIAQRYCVQVDYRLRSNHYYAIGFENDAHGYELRSSFFKGSCSPKHITCIARGSSRCNLYEGFIDFLSAERLGYNDGMDSIILNSTSNLPKALAPLAVYSVIACYLDNDEAGRAALARVQHEFGDRVMDKSTLYPNHKDLNAYLMSLYPKKSTKLKF